MLVVALIFLKWYKRRLARNQALDGSSHEGARGSGGPTRAPPEGMSERAQFAIPTGLANLSSLKTNRMSRQTLGTISSTAGSEQGFVRVSGRKIQSVLQSGGDGYGDPAEPSHANMNLDGASAPEEPRGGYGGSEGGSPVAPVNRRKSGIANWRPSPARTPTIQQSSFSDLTLDHPPPSRPDGGGHSRASYEGSNAGSHASASRFTEAV